jgi:single-strand DNA-binding protein
MNSVILIGRLTKDPELKYTKGSGKAICNFNLAVDRPFAKEKTADFFRIVAFGKTGENAAQYLAKGRLVAVQGRIQNNNYEDKNGTKHYGNDIIADRVEFLEWGNKKEEEVVPGFVETDDDIPF